LTYILAERCQDLCVFKAKNGFCNAKFRNLGAEVNWVKFVDERPKWQSWHR